MLPSAFLYDFIYASFSGRSAMNIEERINLKLLVQLRKTLSQAFEMPQPVYGYNIMSYIRLFERRKKFKEECEEVKDDSMSRRSSTSRTEVNVRRVRQLVCVNRRLAIRIIGSRYLSRVPPNGRVRHKAFLRWVRAQCRSSNTLGVPKKASGPVGIFLKRGASDATW